MFKKYCDNCELEIREGDKEFSLSITEKRGDYTAPHTVFTEAHRREEVERALTHVCDRCVQSVVVQLFAQRKLTTGNVTTEQD